MRVDEDRIDAVEDYSEEHANHNARAIVRALCEVARQLNRIADTYEYVEGLDVDDEEEDDEPEEQNGFFQKVEGSENAK